MALKLKTAPVLDPVTLAEAKAHCRIDHADDDAYLAMLIKAATSHYDGYQGLLGRCIMQQTWELSYDAFPSEGLRIPLIPVTSIDSVEYIDAGTAVLTTWPLTEYQVDLASLYAWVVPNTAWPSPMETVNAVKVTFKAGYALQDAVPASLKWLILITIGHWYENREMSAGTDVATEIPFIAQVLMNQWKVKYL